MRKLEFKVLSGDADRTKFMQAADVFSDSKVLGEYNSMVLTVDSYTDTTDETVLKTLLEALQGAKQVVSFIYLNDDVLWCNPKVQCVSTGYEWYRLYDFIKAKFPSLEVEPTQHMLIKTINGRIINE